MTAGHGLGRRTYDRVADPMTRWGADVLDRLPLRGDETVLDAGCGSGRVTELLAERLPRGRVVALDGSTAMIDAARAAAAPVRRPRRVRGRGPAARCRSATRASTRSFDGDLPLGRGPRGAVPEPRRGPAARGPAGRAVRRRGNIAAVRAALPAIGAAGRAMDIRLAGRDARRLEAAGFRAWRPGSTTSPRRSSPARRSRYLRTVFSGPTWSGSGPDVRGSSGGRDPPADGVDRLRPAQHPLATRGDGGEEEGAPAA